MNKLINSYTAKLIAALNLEVMHKVPKLARELLIAWQAGRSICLCGNGGSAGNAMVILPFCKGARSRNVMQPWPVSASV